MNDDSSTGTGLYRYRLAHEHVTSLTLEECKTYALLIVSTFTTDETNQWMAVSEDLDPATEFE